MKKKIKYGFVCWLFILVPVFSLLADPPGPPNPGGDPSGGENPPVGAPIDEGTGFLMVLGGMYGGWKLYQMKKRKICSIRIE